MNYCLPLLCRTTFEVEKQLVKHAKSFSYFEIWLEYVEDVSTEWVFQIAKRWKRQVIFLFRRLHLSPVQTSVFQRREWLSVLADTESYVDFDLLSQEEDLKYWLTLVPNGSARLLLSVHDYEKTPDTPVLHQLLERMVSFSPWICKVATMCQTQSDAVRIMSLFSWFSESFPSHSFLFLGMGEHGLVTRVFGSLWGNKMIFAPLEQAGSSASGQLVYEQYKALYAILEGEV